MRNNNQLTRKVFIAFMMSVLTVLSWDCSNPKEVGPFNSNIPPKTRLSNVPPLDDTIITKSPRLTLNWVGDDPDGFVVGFRYRWNFWLSETDGPYYKPYKIVLNLDVEQYTLMVETENAKAIPSVYRFFVNLLGNNEGRLSPTLRDSLSRGDSIWVENLRVYASNPDSARTATGLFVVYSFPVHDNPNTGNFIFDSQDTLNFHTFEVSAIDNMGDTSSNTAGVTARVSFQTPQVLPPNVAVESGPTDTALVLMEKTPTFDGLRFTFSATDPNSSRGIDFRWVVDKDIWEQRVGKANIPWSVFSPTDNAYVTARDFPNPFDTTHTLYVQARNEFGSIDTALVTIDPVTGDTLKRAYYQFNTLYPRFMRPDLPKQDRIAIINHSYDALLGTPSRPYYQMVNDYYRSILNGLGKPDSIIQFFRVDNSSLFPKISQLSDFSLIIVVLDVLTSDYNVPAKNQIGVSAQNVLRSYCYIGGDLIMGGWGLNNGFRMSGSDEIFQERILHVSPRKKFDNRIDLVDSLIRVIGDIDTHYPDLFIDQAKADSGWMLGMPQLKINFPVGFGEIIHKFDSKTNNFFTENAPLSIRYLGITFNAVYFGVPLYYFERPAVDSTLSRVLQDFKFSKGIRP